MAAAAPAAAAPTVAAAPGVGDGRAALWRGLGWANLVPPRPLTLRPVVCGCRVGAAELCGVGACRTMAEAGGPPDGRATCRGAARCADTCGAATCGAARGAAMCGAARAAGAACVGGAPPPCLCGCAAAVVAVAAAAIKNAAMRMFHWNMALNSCVATGVNAADACGFRFRRGRGLHEAYMACDKFDDQLSGIVRLKNSRD